MVNKVFSKLQIDTPITTKKNYLQFLDVTGKIAFKLYEKQVSPVQLLDNLVDVVEGLPLQNQSSVLEALNSFVDHDHTTQWLNTFNSNVHDDLDSIIENIIT